MNKMKLAQIARELRSGTSPQAQETRLLTETALELYRRNDELLAALNHLLKEWVAWNPAITGLARTRAEQLLQSRGKVKP